MSLIGTIRVWHCMSYLKEPVDEFFASHQSLKVVFYQLFSTQLLVFILPISASTHLVMGASSHKPNKNPLIFCSPAKNPTFRSRKHFYIIYHTVSLNFFLVWTSQFTFTLSFKSFGFWDSLSHQYFQWSYTRLICICVFLNRSVMIY